MPRNQENWGQTKPSNMYHARTLDQSRSSSWHFLSDEFLPGPFACECFAFLPPACTQVPCELQERSGIRGHQGGGTTSEHFVGVLCITPVPRLEYGLAPLQTALLLARKLARSSA